MSEHQDRLSQIVTSLKNAGIRVSLFVDAQEAELQASAATGADIVELHTGRYCDARDPQSREQALRQLQDGAKTAFGLGLEVHAGHGLNFETVGPVAQMPEIRELNIGHFLIGAAVFTGLEDAIMQMRALMQKARAG